MVELGASGEQIPLPVTVPCSGQLSLQLPQVLPGCVCGWASPSNLITERLRGLPISQSLSLPIPASCPAGTASALQGLRIPSASLLLDLAKGEWHSEMFSVS